MCYSTCDRIRDRLLARLRLHRSIANFLLSKASSNPASPARSVFIRTPSSPLYLTVATLMENIVGPLSTGSLRLASTDVIVNPIVRFNYFRNPLDVERCVNGTRKIRDVLRSRAMEDFMEHERF